METKNGAVGGGVVYGTDVVVVLWLAPHYLWAMFVGFSAVYPVSAKGESSRLMPGAAGSDDPRKQTHGPSSRVINHSSQWEAIYRTYRWAFWSKSDNPTVTLSPTLL